MSFINDMRDANKRFPQHVNELKMLLKRYGIRSLTSFEAALRNLIFKNDFKAVCLRFAECEGGKVSLTLILGVVGAALGGVGIALAGGAVGLPLSIIGLIGGMFLGNEADSTGATRKALAWIRKKV